MLPITDVPQWREAPGNAFIDLETSPFAKNTWLSCFAFPEIRKDPFDRMWIAQARVEDNS